MHYRFAQRHQSLTIKLDGPASGGVRWWCSR